MMNNKLCIWLVSGLTACVGAEANDTGETSTAPETSGETDTNTDTDADTETGESSDTGEALGYRAEVWADNWSAMYIGETMVMEDSVSITTERSFNSEIFTFEATPPFLINVVMKDYIANDSGLEYIGEPNQQMGDGGYIAQFTDLASEEVVAVSGTDWRCHTIHVAPLNKECEGDPNPEETCEAEISEEPSDWKREDFDDSAWVAATQYSEAEVSPKDPYYEISWDADAAFIWGEDLESHNTILCRAWVTS